MERFEEIAVKMDVEERIRAPFVFITFFLISMVVLAFSVGQVESSFVQVGLVYSDHAPYDSMNVSSLPWRPWRGGLLTAGGIFKYDQTITVALYNATPSPTKSLVAYFSGRPSEDGNVTLSLPYMHDGTLYRLVVSWNFTS